MLGRLFRLLEQLFYQSRNGTVESEVWRGFVRQMHDIVAYPGFEAWWAARSHWFGEQFRTFVDSHRGPDNRPKSFGEGGA